MYAAYFPITESNPDQCQAMRISMAYLHGTGLIYKLPSPEMLVAAAIADAWKRGMRHPIRLANAGIVCAERTARLGTVPNLFKILV
jgi:hypothetical protein